MTEYVDGVAQLKGDEIIEVREAAIPCGKSIKTRYLHPETKELIREDVRIEGDLSKIGMGVQDGKL